MYYLYKETQNSVESSGINNSGKILHQGIQARRWCLVNLRSRKHTILQKSLFITPSQTHRKGRWTIPGLANVNPSMAKGIVGYKLDLW